MEAKLRQCEEEKVAIHFDMNILDKIPVRQSINLDVDNLIYLQNSEDSFKANLFGVNQLSRAPFFCQNNPSKINE